MTENQPVSLDEWVEKLPVDHPAREELAALKRAATPQQDNHKNIRALIEALAFYADPETYFAIGFFPDPPCGDFLSDFDDTKKPGALARKVLKAYLAKNPAVRCNSHARGVCCVLDFGGKCTKHPCQLARFL